MATTIKTAGTSASTSLKALQWLPYAGVSTTSATSQWLTDLAQMNAYISGSGAGASGIGSTKQLPIPVTESGIIHKGQRGENQLIGVRSAINAAGSQVILQPADWLIVDPISGWAFSLPDQVFSIASHVWTHS